MPIDGHSYLVAQGWNGKGTGLRHGSISKPLAISQKRTLSGIGKDRDEAFPFWDHVFAAAAKSIQVKIDADGSSGPSDSENEPVPILERTATGLISNRRPLVGTPASASGSSTPSVCTKSAGRLSVLALAKKEAAKRGLYARFFRGPVLGPDSSETLSALIDANGELDRTAAENESRASPQTAVNEREGAQKRRKKGKKKTLDAQNCEVANSGENHPELQTRIDKKIRKKKSRRESPKVLGKCHDKDLYVPEAFQDPKLPQEIHLAMLVTSKCTDGNVLSQKATMMQRISLKEDTVSDGISKRKKRLLDSCDVNPDVDRLERQKKKSRKHDKRKESMQGKP